jgi:hypothetical protein
VAAKSSDKRSTIFYAKLLQAADAEPIDSGRKNEKQNLPSLFRKALSSSEFTSAPNRLRFSRPSKFNVLRQTQTAYNRSKFPERSPKAIKDSK